MVGLFWIDRDGCWLGAPPGRQGTGVRLTDEGLEAVGMSPADSLSWGRGRMERVAVPDAPVRSAFRRGLSTVVSLATAAAGIGGPESPPLMTVRVTHVGGDTEHTVSSAAWPAYTEREVELSHRLLERFVTGELRPSLLTEWWRSVGPDAAPKPVEREEVLEWLLDRGTER